MSSKRKIRRAKISKGGAQLGSALKGATEQLANLSGLAEVPGQLMAINDEVLETRALVEAVIGDHNELVAELEMQRAVTIRLAQAAWYEGVMTSRSQAATGATGCPNWVDLEAELRAEYVAAMFLEWTATLAK